MNRTHSLVVALPLALACTVTNPPYDAGIDVYVPDGARACDPTDCASGRCVNGRCAEACGDAAPCPTGETCCGGACADLTDDSENCGACGSSCGIHTCARSACADVL